jgi:hypothetical protein
VLPKQGFCSVKLHFAGFRFSKKFKLPVMDWSENSSFLVLEGVVRTICAPGDQRKGSDNQARVGRTERIASSAACRISDDVIAARQAMMM